MDKEQQKRVPQGDKNSQVTKSSSSSTTTATTSTASQRVKSWAPSSKFNKILSNLERSILNQFNGSSHGTGGASGSSNSSSGSSASLIKTKGQAGSKSSAAAALTIGAPTSASQLSPTNEVSSQRNNKRCNGQQVQKDPAPSKGITLQLKSEPTRVKTTLNKYQQQIVSTMRPNHQSILNSGGGTSSSSSSNGYNNNNNNNKMSNKLSIPPPHANNEARNQNHRIIFGASAMPNPTKLSSDSIVVGSSATLRPSTNNRLVANTTTSNSRGESIKQNVQQNNAETSNLIRNNASPASSAKSLPTTAIATKPTIGSQTFNKSINEDEESGFSTYQSRRSLFGDNTKINNPTSINTATQSTGGGQNTQQNSNNMIIMQTQTQVPIGAITFNNNSNNNNLATSQQLVYNYQYPQLKHPLQQQTMNTHHQLVANNQVPIPSTTNIDQSNKNCYQNHPSQLHPFHNNAQQRLNQNHFSDQHLLKNTPFPPLHHQQQQQSHQLYNLYALNPGQVQVQVPDNGQQEIYANAPPKPRRYQYYDPSNPPTHLLPPQMIANMTAATSTAMTTSTISSMANGNSIIHQQPMLNRLQQIPYNQPIYNFSYIQVPNLYHQQQGLPVQVNNNQQQIPYNGGNDNHQQPRPLNPPYPFTKSKSSLDACDLIQYKLDAQNRSNTLRLGTQHRQQDVHLQQQHQSIYGSRLDNLNHYPNTVQGQQSGMQFFGNNLQRSKSVSHLLQPDYERQQMTQQHQKEQFVDHGHAIGGPKFYSVSSASTTNLNLVGLSNNNQQQISQQQNQFAKLPSHSNHSHNQPPQQLYHDLVQKQGNQLFSATTNTITTTAQRQQQQHPQRQNNNWQQQQNQVLPSNCNELSNQHQRPRGTPQNPLNNNNNNAAKTTNVAFSNCATKIVRQPPQSLGDKFILEDGFGKPSLDDKIRYLMIGEDNSNAAAAANANIMVNSSITNSQNDKNPIYHPSGNNANLSQQAAWAAQQQQHQQQQVSIPVESSVANCNSILKRESNSNGRQNAITNNSNSNHSPPRGQGYGSKTSSTQKNLGDESAGLTNSIYINDLASKMGNRQQRQYQVTSDTNQHQYLNSSPSNRNNTNNSDSFRMGKNSSNNSHLIVDLTTPRVLAKTQTTLSSGDLNADAIQRRDSCSINQVGLPQQPVELMTGAQRSMINVSDSNNVVHQQQEHQSTRTNTNAGELSIIKNDSNNKLNSGNFNNRVDTGANSICERTAPYYYSDLKSEEQRQALLSIVQHKSLSPPPQLLSRSTDQSSTRLALKSATLHPGHMRILNEAKERQQCKAQVTNGFNTTKNLKYHLPNSEFNSTSNISKNIDKLFESPAQQPRINAVQSMLALNDYVCEDTCQTSQQLSNFQATSESTSVGYFSGDMKSKNFSKSKSLENLNQGIFDDQAKIGSPHPTHLDTSRSKKGGNPVYENIRRSDKLMSAINNSTTCLSTSTTRSSTNRTKPPSYLAVESQNVNSEESTDSILGSSLDESDSSLDLIDEIKISPSDNHLSDISQLIEQLKVNHSKLSEEYTSTMARIAKTISTKNKQANADHKNDKLSKRLHLLEQKSKKCESRSKNQLALIQMMEKVLQQSKARTTIAPSVDDNSLSSSVDSSSKPCIINNNNKERISTSPSLSFDYQNLKQSVQSSYTSPTCSNSTSTLNSQHSLISDTMRNFNDQPFKTSNAKQQHGVIKAIVTEGQTKIVSEVKRQDSEVGSGQVSLSTRHHQQNLQARNSLGAAVPSAEMMKLHLDGRTTTNPFSEANEGEDDDDDDSTTTSSESSVEEVRRITNNNNNKSSKEIENKNSSNNSATDGLDEEDFIEFLTTNTSEHHHHHNSQFGASQFSASDFNNGQASTGGGSEARQATTNKSNNSYPSKNHLFSNGGASMNTTGILKSAKNGFNSPKNNNIENNINNNNINVSRNNNKGTIDNGKDSIDRSKFNNVLGNVIDVDVCPMNNLSESSPVNNRASCLN